MQVEQGQAREDGEVLNTRVGDRGAAEVDALEGGEALERLDARVGDGGAREVDLDQDGLEACEQLQRLIRAGLAEHGEVGVDEIAGGGKRGGVGAGATDGINGSAAGFTLLRGEIEFDVGDGSECDGGHGRLAGRRAGGVSDRSVIGGGGVLVCSGLCGRDRHGGRELGPSERSDPCSERVDLRRRERRVVLGHEVVVVFGQGDTADEFARVGVAGDDGLVTGDDGERIQSQVALMAALAVALDARSVEDGLDGGGERGVDHGR
ncbi:MAG: hypothetical protein GIKADHBN_01291 [Phycisphaerales bacterium]|nr:hypothetical protein [Phycisphaerales bacterium]